MRRIRKEATQVWHNPEISDASRRGAHGPRAPLPAAESPEDRRSQSRHRAALEALFTPKKEPEPEEARAAARVGREPGAKSPGRIVLSPAPSADPRTAERLRLLGKLLNAEGRPNVSRAADEFLRAGFAFPDEQDVHLQLLEHVDEDHVRAAIDALGALLAGELPRRRAVLESRLRRIEQFADEPSTRKAAEQLRRRVSGRSEAPPGPQG